jgi:regulator of protease activity HflC (stomatin/prohibitin superfamily)
VLVCLVGLALLVLPNLRIVHEGERIVVFRLGRYHRILGPGLNLIVWGVDAAQRVVLDDRLPDWRAMSEQQLATRLEQLAATGQLAPRA